MNIQVTQFITFPCAMRAEVVFEKKFNLTLLLLIEVHYTIISNVNRDFNNIPK